MSRRRIAASPSGVVQAGAAVVGPDAQVKVATEFRAGPAHPAWFHDLVANPDTEVENGTER
ncbi:nitroreductase family deazaflavin-dependent oxidoreductase [Saccharothrix sp. AJ9571]|nr:nitroreductase family deazaflavin-dependent oxidoreductase [Saccharothrix sp. AJ9571]